MLQIHTPLPVKLICTFIYSQEKVYMKAKAIIEKKYGRVDFESERINFNFTDYYYDEMGKPLFRRFIAFERLRKPSDFIKIKLFCLKLENKFAVDNKRIVNIDPGYIHEAKLVLTTTKDFAHRIYLDKGVFAEVTLSFEKGQYRDYPTTFPDYRTDQYKDIFLEIRDIYSHQLKKK